MLAPRFLPNPGEERLPSDETEALVDAAKFLGGLESRRKVLEALKNPYRIVQIAQSYHVSPPPSGAEEHFAQTVNFAVMEGFLPNHEGAVALLQELNRQILDDVVHIEFGTN